MATACTEPSDSTLDAPNRLVPRGDHAVGGAFIALEFFDTKFGLPCRLRADEDGTQRCFPAYPIVSEWSLFADDACTEPAAAFPTEPNGLLLQTGEACTPARYRAFEPGELVTRSYVRGGDGTCAWNLESGPVHTVKQVPANAFEAFEPFEVAISPEVSLSAYRSASGVLYDSEFVDTKRARRCPNPWPSADGTHPCVGVVSSEAVLETGCGARTSRVQLPDGPCGFGVDDVGVVAVGGLTLCEPELRIVVDTEGTWGEWPVESRSGMCEVRTATVYETAPISLDVYPDIQFQRVGGARIQNLRVVAEGVETQFRSLFYDAELESECYVASLGDGHVCVPPRVGWTSTYYADSNCRNAVVAARVTTEEPPRWLIDGDAVVDLGSRIDQPLYQSWPECQPAFCGTYYAPGPPLPRDTFAPITRD